MTYVGENGANGDKYEGQWVSGAKKCEFRVQLVWLQARWRATVRTTTGMEDSTQDSGATARQVLRAVVRR